MSVTYTIWRFHQRGDKEMRYEGLTREQAVNHCEQDYTSNLEEGWFEGWTKEEDDEEDDDD